MKMTIADAIFDALQHYGSLTLTQIVNYVVNRPEFIGRNLEQSIIETVHILYQYELIIFHDGKYILNIALIRTRYETLERQRVLQEREFREDREREENAILQAAQQRYAHLNRNIHEHDMRHEDRRRREREVERQHLNRRRQLQRNIRYRYQRNYE